jgi:hypothetical protein
VVRIVIVLQVIKMLSRTRFAAAVGIFAALSLNAQFPKQATAAPQAGPSIPLRAGPAYPSEKPDKWVEIVVDLVPPLDPKAATPDYNAIRDNSHLLEEKKSGAAAEKVKAFSETNQAMALAIAIDVSAGMNGERLKSVQKGLLQVINQKREIDKVAIVAFGSEIRRLCDFTTSRETLKAAIEKLKTERDDNPRLYRALDETLKLIISEDSILPARRRVLVVAQGKNPGTEAGGESGFQASDVIAQAVRMQVPIDAIGVQAPPPAMNDSQKLAIIVFGDSDSAQKQSADPLVYLENMERLAARTSGMYTKHTRTDKDLGQRLSDGVKWLMASPVLRFPVQNLPYDGKTHAVGVRIGSSDLELAGAVLLWADDAFSGMVKKYGYYFLGGLLLMVLLIVGLQSRRKPVRRQPISQGGATPRTPTRPGATPTNNNPNPRPNFPPANQPQFTPQGFEPPRSNVVQRGGTVPEPAQPRRSGTVVVNSSFRVPAPGQPTCSLLVVNGPNAGTRLPVEAQQALVGRGLQLPLSCAFDPAISDPHAEIRYQGGVVLLVDLNSINGTYLNGIKLTAGQPASLNLGDRIHMGQTDFQVV